MSESSLDTGEGERLDMEESEQVEISTNGDTSKKADSRAANADAQPVKSLQPEALPAATTGEEKKKQESIVPNREVRDSMFKSVFSSLPFLLLLYQVLHPEDTAATIADLKNVTLHPVLALSGLFDDLCFMVRDKLFILMECQTKWSEAMAFRMLEYIVSQFGQYGEITNQDRYGTHALVFPKTELYLVYVGNRGKVPKELDMASVFGLEPGETGPRSMKIKVYSTQTGNIGDLLEKVHLPSAEEVNMILDPALRAGDLMQAMENGSIAPATDWTMMADGHQANILEQYVAFCRIHEQQLKVCKTPMAAIAATLYICRRHGILEEYLAGREREVQTMLNDLYDEEKIIRVGMENAVKKAREDAQTRVLQLIQENNLMSPEQLATLQNKLAACDAGNARVAAN